VLQVGGDGIGAVVQRGLARVRQTVSADVARYAECAQCAVRTGGLLDTEIVFIHGRLPVPGLGGTIRLLGGPVHGFTGPRRHRTEIPKSSSGYPQTESARVHVSAKATWCRGRQAGVRQQYFDHPSQKGHRRSDERPVRRRSEKDKGGAVPEGAYP